MEPMFKNIAGGFPGAVDKNLPANAEDTGLSPGPGRPHMPQLRLCTTTYLLQSPWATATEAHVPTAHAPRQEEQREASAPQLESGPHSLQRGQSPRTATKTLRSQK